MNHVLFYVPGQEMCERVIKSLQATQLHTQIQYLDVSKREVQRPSQLQAIPTLQVSKPGGPPQFIVGLNEIIAYANTWRCDEAQPSSMSLSGLSCSFLNDDLYSLQEEGGTTNINTVSKKHSQKQTVQASEVERYVNARAELDNRIQQRRAVNR